MGIAKWVGVVLVSTKRDIAIAEMAGAGTPTALRDHRSMTDYTATADKSIVTELSFGVKTSKRVGWEAWEFGVEAPHLVRVTNASYGFEKADHSYLVGVKDRDGLLLPAECECPADKYNEEYDCKHKVALATIGGPVVLQAAVDYPTPMGDATSALGEQIRADGGAVTEEMETDTPPLNAEEHRECDCEGLTGDLPCWPCVQTGRRELPE